MMTLWEPFVGTQFESYQGAAYFYQWSQGQSKVLELTLILAAIYFAKNKSVLAAPLLILSAFDPRFTLLALPVFLYFTIKNHVFKRTVLVGLIASVWIVIAFTVYYGVLDKFINYHQYGLFTFYAYEWIPFYSIVTLTLGVVLVEFWRRGELGNETSEFD